MPYIICRTDANTYYPGPEGTGWYYGTPARAHRFKYRFQAQCFMNRSSVIRNAVDFNARANFEIQKVKE